MATMVDQPKESQPDSGNRGTGDVAEPSPDFIERVLAEVKTIPPGRVMTYGDIAARLTDHADLAGAAGAYGARLVGQVMLRAGSGVAWWRVIRSTGHPPKFHESQALPFYIEEGTPLTGSEENYRIDLKRARLSDDAQATLRLF